MDEFDDVYDGPGRVVPLHRRRKPLRRITLEELLAEDAEAVSAGRDPTAPVLPDPPS